jgi:hypothetical protein
MTTKSEKNEKTSDAPFDPGVSTPSAYEPGAGQPVPGSPYMDDVASREEGERKMAELDAENQRRYDEQKPVVPDNVAEEQGKAGSGSGGNGGVRTK